MIRIRSCALAAVLLSLVLPAPGNAASRRKLCRRVPCHVVLRDGSITVLRAVARSTARHPDVEPLLRTIACWRSRDTCKWLGDETQPTYELNAGPLAAGGRFLVYGFHLAGQEEPDQWRVKRLDVETGRLETFGVPGGFSRLHGGLLGIVVNPSGALGWMTAGEYVFPAQGERFVSPERRVYGLAARSRTLQLLASSPAVEAGSLAASETRLYWTEGGQVREAPL